MDDMISAPPKRTKKRLSVNADLARLARRALGEHPHFRGRTDGFQFKQQGDVLIVRGYLPSFYLRNLVQEVLKRLDGVREVDNQIDVACCDGLSSVRTSQRVRPP